MAWQSTQQKAYSDGVRFAREAMLARQNATQNSVYQNLGGDLRNLTNAPTWTGYPGELTPDMNPLLSSAYSGFGNYIENAPWERGVMGAMDQAGNLASGGFDPYAGGVGGAAGGAITAGAQMPDAAMNLDPAAREALGGFLGGGANPWLDQAVASASKAPIKALQEQIIPGIDAQYLGAGQYGGSRQMLDVGKAVENTTGQIGDIATRMYGSAYESDAGRRMQALGLSTDIAGQNANLGLASTAARLNAAGLGLQGAQLGLQGQQIGMQNLPNLAQLPGQIFEAGAKLGLTQNELQQIAIDKDAQNFLYNQQAQGMQLEQAMELLPYMFPEKYKNTQVSGGSKPNAAGAAVGGAVAGYGATKSPYGALAGGIAGYLSAR